MFNFKEVLMLTHHGHDAEPVKKHWFMCYGTNYLVLYFYCIWLMFVFSHVFSSGLPSLRLGLLEDCLWWSSWAWVLPYQWGGRASRRREPWDASWRLRLDTVHLLFLFFFLQFFVQAWIQKTDRKHPKDYSLRQFHGAWKPEGTWEQIRNRTRNQRSDYDPWQSVCLLR